jgi:hypothetical protein
MFVDQSSLAKPAMPGEHRFAGSANPDENRLDAEIFLHSGATSSWTDPTLSCDSSLS